MFCIGPVASALSNRFGFRVVVITGSLFGFVGLLTSAFAQSVENLFFTLGLLFGFAICLVFTPIIVNISFYFDKKRALATGIAICGSGAGTFVFAPVVNWLLKTYALRGTFLILVSVRSYHVICTFLIANFVFLYPKMLMGNIYFISTLKEWDLFELWSFWSITHTAEISMVQQGAIRNS
jgi:MFS family permease